VHQVMPRKTCHQTNMRWTGLARSGCEE
jgi:hypothetical protein